MKSVLTVTNFIERVLVAALVALSAGGCGGGGSKSAQSAVDASNAKSAIVTITSSQKQTYVVDAELAVTDQQHAVGLMNRESLAPDAGMLFVFSTVQPLSFWMKNTLIPLDMLFIDSSLKIVDINRSAVPGDLNPFTSALPGKYVLEVNGGYCNAKSITIGDSISIEYRQ